MATKNQECPISEDLLAAVRSFPVERDVEHCGIPFKVSPFEFYAVCPHCGTRIKLRSFSGVPEMEDLFDAVFEWLSDPQARRFADQRRQAIEDDRDDDEE
ncbi:MAG: hypothetical protein WD066_02435 [Planctomycetaceae bacterium]